MFIASLSFAAGKKNPSVITSKLSQADFFPLFKGEPLPKQMIPYDVNSWLWSDGTFKTRYIVLPSDKSQITFHKTRAWNFPAGTRLIKNFYLENPADGSQTRKIIETRILLKTKQGDKQAEKWAGYSYIWNNNQTEAVLLEKDSIHIYPVLEKGVKKEFKHLFPSRSACLECHYEVSEWVLGPKTSQMNMEFDYAKANVSVKGKKNQLTFLKAAGFLKGLATDPQALPKQVNPADTSKPLEARALSYLDANCAHCHRPDGEGGGEFNLLYGVPLQKRNLIRGEPDDNMEIEDAKVVLPGKPEKSTLYLRMISKDFEELHMPPLATFKMDSTGIQVVRNWILSLK